MEILSANFIILWPGQYHFAFIFIRNNQEQLSGLVFYAKICSLPARRQSRQPVQRVYWPENVIDWLGKWRPTCVMRHARGQKLQSFRRKWPFYMDLGPRKDARNRETLGTRMVSDRNRTCGPAILVQRSKQAAEAIKLSSSINCKLMYVYSKVMPMEGEKSGFGASTLDRPAENFPYKRKDRDCLA